MAESTSSGCQPIDVHDLAHRAGINLQDLDEECRDHHLLDFAELCDPWELVGYHLKLTQQQINAIKEDYNSAEMRRIMVLQRWKETVLTCTYRALVEAFLKCNKAQQALTICEAVKVYLSTTRDNEGQGQRREETTPQQIAHHDGATASIQSSINRVIKDSLRELDRHFSHVQMLLINTAGVTLRDLRLRISTLASFSGDPTQLLRSSTIEEFFHSLKQHCNALCPDILEDLIEQVGDEEAKREMREFKLKCEAFRRETKLKDMIGNYEGPTSVPLNYIELEIKLGDGWREKTLEDLENLQCRISFQSRVLKMIREGSLIVTYLVPISLDLIIEDLISFLQELDVLQITMDKKCIFKQGLGVVGSSTEKTDVCSPSPNFGVFDVGNVIQVDWPDSAPWYGVIKWIGHLGEKKVLTAGIEMEHEVKGGGSGSFQGTQYFSCPEGLGLFLPVCRLKRGGRFEDIAPSESSPKSQMESGVGTMSQPGDSPTSTRSSDPSDLLSNLRKFELQEPSSKEEPEMVAVDLEVFINEISKLIGLEWKFLARALEFEQSDIDAIEYKDIRNLKEQIYQMFHEWKKQEGQRATAGRLLSAIKEADLYELLKGLREKGIILPRLQSSAAFASSLAAGARAPIQASDDSQPDGPVRPKATAVSASVQGHTPPTERDFVRQQRLKRFSSSASDKSNSEMVAYTTVERTTSHDSTGSSLQSAVGVVGSSTEKTDVSSPLSPTFGVFDVGKVIQVDRPDSAPWYGVIKWIGRLGEKKVLTAGIEMEHEVKGGGSGSFQGTQYFSCPEGLGVFLPVCRLKQDSRFEDPAPSESSPKSQMEGGVGTASQPGDSPTSTRSNLSDLLSNLRKFELQESSSKKDAEQPALSESETSGVKGFELQIPADRAGLVIGAGGKNIREVERLTNTSIKVDGGPGQFGGQNRKVLVIGSEENCKKAILMIMKNIQRRVDEHTAGAKTIFVPERCVEKIIGKGGATISTIKSLSGAHDIKIEDRKTGLEAFLQTERQCHIHGSEEAIEKAEKFIRLAMAGEDIVAGATFAAIFVELMKMGVQCQEESSS